MGVLFSRPETDSANLPAGAFPVGDLSSLRSSAIKPYLGLNTGLYSDVSTQNLPPVPFEWMISPEDTDKASCPDGSNILIWFAITEAVIVVLAVIVAHRSFPYRLSFRFLGRRIKNSVWVTWTIPFICQLVSNAIAAGVAGNTPGYEHLNKLHIFTTYMARPRFYFVPLAILRTLVNVRRPASFDKTNIIQRGRDDRVEFPYTDAWITTAISELLMLVMGSIFTGVTWNRMPSNSQSREFMHDFVAYVCGAPGMMVLCMVAFFPVFKRYGEAFPVQQNFGEAAFRPQGRRYAAGSHWGATVNKRGEARIAIKSTPKKGIAAKRAVSAIIGGVFLAFIVLIQWSYWTRFLEMPGVL